MTAPTLPISVDGPLQPSARFGVWHGLVRNRSGLIALVILGFFTLLAIAPDLLVGKLETAVTANGPRLGPPSAAYRLKPCHGTKRSTGTGDGLQQYLIIQFFRHLIS